MCMYTHIDHNLSLFPGGRSGDVFSAVASRQPVWPAGVPLEETAHLAGMGDVGMVSHRGRPCSTYGACRASRSMAGAP